MAGMSGSIMMARKYSWEWEILEMERENECLQLQYYYEETSSSSPTRGCSGFNNNNNNGGFNMMNQVLLDYKMISEEDQELFEINIKEERPNLETIREDEEEEESSTVFSLDFHVHDYHKDVVYVAVGDYSSSSSSSMEALSWALKHAITPSTTLCLLHVFPQLNFIPTPMGKIPRTHVNAEHVNVYLTLEKAKRKLLLQKFIDLCVASKVKVETVLIEGDSVAKAIVDLVGNLNIRKLVIGIGTTQYSNRSRRGGSKRKNAIAKMVLKNSEQENCDIKIICEGREVIDQMINININIGGGDHLNLTSPRNSSSSSSSSSSSVSSNLPDHHHHQSRPAGIVPLKRTFITNPLWLLFMPTFLSPRSIINRSTK